MSATIRLMDFWGWSMTDILKIIFGEDVVIYED